MLVSPPPAESINTFEREIASFTGASHAISFSSARAACMALLKTLDYPKDASILMPSLNYPAIPKTVNAMGYKVMWVPLDPRDLRPDIDKLSRNIPNATAALIWPHHFGFPGPLDELTKFCADKGIDLIEDCAHALGTRYKDRHVGTFGKAAFISFETSKMVNTFGGGVIITSDGNLAQKLFGLRAALPPRKASAVIKGIIKSYAEYTLTGRWGFTLILYPALMASKRRGGCDFLVEGLGAPAAAEVAPFSAIQAEAGLCHLKLFSNILDTLKKQHSQIQARLENAGMAVPVAANGEPNGYMTAGITEDADRLAAAFFKRGIDIKMRYMQDCQLLGFGTECSQCSTFSERLFHLPNRTGLSNRTFSNYLSTIDAVLKEFGSNGRKR